MSKNKTQKIGLLHTLHCKWQSGVRDNFLCTTEAEEAGFKAGLSEADIKIAVQKAIGKNMILEYGYNYEVMFLLKYGFPNEIILKSAWFSLMFPQNLRMKVCSSHSPTLLMTALPVRRICR